MDYLLRVALWQIPTLISDDPDNAEYQPMYNAVGHLQAAEKCRILEERVKAAAGLFAGWPATNGARVIDVFAAPEYYFAESSTKHFTDEATKDLIVTRLKRISERSSNVLLIPGTIAWKKPISRPPSRLNVFRKDRATRAIDRLRMHKTIVAQDSQTLQRSIDRITQGQATYLGANTSFIYRNGKLLLKYHKRADGGEVSQSDHATGRVVWIPGPRQSVFTVEGVKFGLEICREHASHMLTMLGAPPVDVLVVISSHISPVPRAENINQGGYCLHSDTSSEPSVRQRQADGSFTQVARRYGFAASTMSPGQIQQRVTDFVQARADKGGVVTAQRQADHATQLGGHVYYYLLPFSN